jgi:DNA mismatch endonuclease (patch repair protein)
MKKKTADQVSFNMKQVKYKDSQIEILLRKELWKRGLRYRKNVAKIFGKPDIVFSKEKIAIFCDSEFWHGYKWNEKKHEIKTRREFWIPKIERTIERDKEVTKFLRRNGWIVIRFWGKDIIKNSTKCADTVEKTLFKIRLTID